MNKLKKMQGITLIALVITIIVLLILAGVSIAMLTGDNGILTKAQSSKNKNDEASVEEKIKLSVMYSRMNTNGDSEINLLELEDELKRNFNNDVSIDKKGENNNLPWYVSNNGYMFEIKEDGTVVKASGIVLSPSQIKVIEGAQTQEITATLTQGVSGTITWSSTNDTIAKVTENATDNKKAVIEFVGTGTAMIIASVEGTEYSAECTVTIVSKVTSISVDNFSIEVNEEKIIELKTIPSENVEDLIYTYEVIAGSSYVTVDKDSGKVKGVAEGIAQIKITGMGISGTNLETTCEVTVKLEEFARSNVGKIDIVFVNKNNQILNIPNTPPLGDGMVPVRWNQTDTAWYVCNKTDNDWYSYTTTDKQWANIMMRDGLVVEGITDTATATIEEMAGKKVTTEGSMFVYIPRYAYKITYYAEDGTTITGYSNSEGIVTAKGNLLGDTYRTNAIRVDKNSQDTKYVLHPAFDYNGAAEGIWVAKFEASKNSNNEIQIKPGVTTWRNTKISDIYTNCLNYDSTVFGDENLNSHMMKNTEWGAVAYLAQSNYGKNNEVWKNPNSNRITGQAGTTAKAKKTASTYSYTDNTYGVQASTTGTVYGIYDMSGGTDEFVAAYVDNGSSALLSYGKSLVDSTQLYTKDVYPSAASNGNSDKNVDYVLSSKLYGDAIYETSYGGDIWYGAELKMVYPEDGNCFFLRGRGIYDSGAYGGIFSYSHSETIDKNLPKIGFRVCLIKY